MSIISYISLSIYIYIYMAIYIYIYGYIYIYIYMAIYIYIYIYRVRERERERLPYLSADARLRRPLVGPARPPCEKAGSGVWDGGGIPGTCHSSCADFAVISTTYVSTIHTKHIYDSQTNSVVSRAHMTCRLLKSCLLDHPMNSCSLRRGG